MKLKVLFLVSLLSGSGVSFADDLDSAKQAIVDAMSANRQALDADQRALDIIQQIQNNNSSGIITGEPCQFHIDYAENVAWACTEADANLNHDPSHESGYSDANRQARSCAQQKAIVVCQAQFHTDCTLVGFMYQSFGLDCNVRAQAAKK